ncbi:metal ABC transporter solute-binding protein, Zn/Mn family [Lacticaseibacillus thailandensis]|uniref:ABC superfamily ATP binding cassette transporter, binding protein n=1 Tax=Lacticaseibacillus thailandensis DSM 22698 = JCM 13996 TaxID=1423810 RepID=A0A0R2C8A5_9LACO|nr:zinc ABC transporter substrate-binding protein [Lacticaseibacillus thailandensis]KRM87234.1 ABC superfamily ATP binding cassette transporter, binding protein [Lacticaseibacillus thailandensis DSM 22698 = JCM 13996]
MQQKHTWWTVIVPLVLIIAVTGFIINRGLAQQQQGTTQKSIHIVASLDFYGEMAQGVAGKYASVSSVIQNTKVDPHDYEPTSDVAKEYAAADIIISNGGGYDKWSSQFAQQNSGAKAITVAQLTGYKTGGNEHLWYKPSTARKVVLAVERQLIKIDPQHKRQYTTNAQRYLAKFKGLRRLERRARQQLAGKRYLATEPVYDNMLTALGAQNDAHAFAEAVDAENDPTATEIRQWQTDVQNHTVAFVINNPQNSGRLVKSAVAYARQHGVPVVNITETKPAGETYIQWQTKELRAVLKALQQ